jgi:hypothetical protein
VWVGVWGRVAGVEKVCGRGDGVRRDEVCGGGGVRMRWRLAVCLWSRRHSVQARRLQSHGAGLGVLHRGNESRVKACSLGTPM